MKPKEMVDIPSRLSWDSVLVVMRESGDTGMSNKEIAHALDADYARVRALTIVMWEAGALSRVHVGEIAGATFYFMPVQEVAENEQRAAAI